MTAMCSSLFFSAVPILLYHGTVHCSCRTGNQLAACDRSTAGQAAPLSGCSRVSTLVAVLRHKLGTMSVGHPDYLIVRC
jgi:hypothetical protein